MTTPAERPGDRRAPSTGAAGARDADPLARTWPVVIAAAAIATAGAAVIWFLAVPRDVVCPAIYPAPPGCATAERVETGFVATGGLLVALVVAVVLLRTVTRGRPGPAAAVLAVLGLLAITLANVVRLA